MKQIVVLFGFVACMPSVVHAQPIFEMKIIDPVEINTGANVTATSEIIVEVTLRNSFKIKNDVRYNPTFLPQFTLYDGAGNYVDTFIVETTPKEGEKQFDIPKNAKDIILKPGEGHSRKIKVWVRALAMEPNRCYMLGDSKERTAQKVPFVPIVKDGREKIRPIAYEQTVRIRYGKEEHCATIFDINQEKKIGFAITIIPDDIEPVEVTPLYHSSKTRPDVLALFSRAPLKGSVKRAKNGIAIIEFPLKVDEFFELTPRFLPLVDDKYKYENDSYIACGWSKMLGVTAPCSAIRGGAINGFTTLYATPRDGWRGSGYFSNSGYLVGICDSGSASAHTSRLGVYVGVRTIREALAEMKHKFSSKYGEKKGDE